MTNLRVTLLFAALAIAAVPYAEPAAEELGASGDAWAEESDDDLRQLLSRAEWIAQDDAGDPDTVAEVRSALEELNVALEARAATLESGQGDPEIDEAADAARERLEAALEAFDAAGAGLAPEPDAGGEYAEDAGAHGRDATELDEPPARREEIVSGIRQIVDIALDVLDRIRERRAEERFDRDQEAWSRRWDDAPPPDDAGGGAYEGDDASGSDTYDAYDDWSGEGEIEGVVVEDGEPLADATITEETTGQSVTTGADGSYLISHLPRGMLAKLALSLKGRPIGEGTTTVAAGRPTPADFDVALKAHVGKAVPKNRIRMMPATVTFRRKAWTGAPAPRGGSVEGVARDAAGRPMPRALVYLDRRTVVRANSAGAFRFVNVPSGPHDLVMHRGGKPVATERVSVAVGAASRPVLRLAAAAKAKPAPRAKLLSRIRRALYRGQLMRSGH